MKKYVIFIVMSFMSISAFCQNAHLSFKGVPIDGTLTEYVNKMKAAGFTHIGTEDGIALMQGDFAGYKNCTIGVQTLKPRNLVHEITVVFPSQEKCSSRFRLRQTQYPARCKGWYTKDIFLKPDVRQQKSAQRLRCGKNRCTPQAVLPAQEIFHAEVSKDVPSCRFSRENHTGMM